jgi:hypothetical protein
MMGNTQVAAVLWLRQPHFFIQSISNNAILLEYTAGLEKTLSG